jgi:hypothetical protein
LIFRIGRTPINRDSVSGSIASAKNFGQHFGQQFSP